MLTSIQKSQIRELNIFQCDILKLLVGKKSTEGFNVPNFFEIKKLILEKLSVFGISKIECVQPYRANCIIRVYQKLDHKYEDEIVNMYGVLCYIKKNNVWTTRNNSKIDFSKCDVGVWFFQDECMHVDCDFYDCYVKIS